jgi:hypothetical protein
MTASHRRHPPQALRATILSGAAAVRRVIRRPFGDHSTNAREGSRGTIDAAQ